MYLLGTILGAYDALRLGRVDYHPLWSLTPFQGKKQIVHQRFGAPNSLTWSTWSSIPRDLNLAIATVWRLIGEMSDLMLLMWVHRPFNLRYLTSSFMAHHNAA